MKVKKKSDPFNRETMLEPYSSQLLINSTLELMLAGEKEEGSDRETEKRMCGKNHICFSVMVKDSFIVDRKACLCC